MLKSRKVTCLWLCCFASVFSCPELGSGLLFPCEGGHDLQHHGDLGALPTHSLVAATSPWEPFSTLVQRSRGTGRVSRGGGVEEGRCWAQAVGWGQGHVLLQQRPHSQAGAAGGCRSAERGSGVACQAASASHPLGSVRPITNSQSLFQHKQDLQRAGSLPVLFLFMPS